MTSSAPISCPDCGGRIPPDAPRGHCLACLTGLIFPDEETPVAGHGDQNGGAPESMDGPVFGPWRVVRPAGEGAFGMVYEAEQEFPVKRKAALKVLKAGLQCPEVLARFAVEREALAVLDHPGIARVLDAGTEGGAPWIASEWVDGARSISEFCQEGKLEFEARIRLFVQVCEAVTHAHQRGVIHRDLKPGNLLVRSDGVVKVIDFGMARATEQVLAGSALVTLAGQVLGTPSYMSPEQAGGQGAEADTRSDIYSLGAVLYELLTGSQPFIQSPGGGAVLHDLLRKVREEEPVRPSMRVPALRGELEWIVLKAMAKDPAHRYETTAALARDLTSWCGGGTVLAAPPRLAWQIRGLFRRHRAAVVGACGILLALLAGLATTWRMYLEARKQEQSAVHHSRAASDREQEIRRQASQADHRTAQLFLTQNHPVTAVMHLARAVRTDPGNPAASGRLAGELMWNDFPRPAHPPAEVAEFIRELKFSPDGKRVAAQCNELNFGPGFTALFDPESGRRVGEDVLPSSLVHAFDFSPDGRILALGHTAGGVSFWKTSDGSADAGRKYLPHENMLYVVVWISGDRLATVEDHGEKTSVGRLWDVESGKILAEVPRLPALARPAVSPDAGCLAWVDSGGVVKVFRVADGNLIGSWPTPGAGTVAFVTGEVLAVQTFGGKLQLHGLPGGEPTGDAMQASDNAFAVKVPPGGRYLVTSGFDGTTTQWNAATQKPERSFAGRFMLAASDGRGSLLALGGALQQEVLLWDLAAAQPARAPLAVAGHAAALALSPDGRWLAAGGRNRQLAFYDLRSRAAKPEILPWRGYLWHVGWNADGSRLAALGTDGQSTVWDADGMEVESAKDWGYAVALAAPWENAAGLMRDRVRPGLHPAPEATLPDRYHPDKSSAVKTVAAVSPDGRRLAVASAEAEAAASAPELVVHPLDLPDAAPLRLILTNPARSVAFSPDGRRVAAGLADGRVAAFDSSDQSQSQMGSKSGGAAKSGNPAGCWSPHTGPVEVLAFLPDGRIVSGAAAGGVAISPPGSPAVPTAPVRQIAVSGDGRWFATGHADATAQLWNAATGQPAGPRMAHTSTTTASGLLVAFSPDGLTLATAGSHDDAVRLWSVPEGTARRVLPHASRVDEIRFDRSGNRLVTLCGEGSRCSLQAWDTSSGLPLMPACVLPAGEGGLSLALHPQGTRAAVASWWGGVFIFDLPPSWPQAPPWLPGLAEKHNGWRFDEAGLPLSGLTSSAAEAGADPWARWMLTDPSTRTVSPFSTQSAAARHRALAIFQATGPAPPGRAPAWGPDFLHWRILLPWIF